MIAQLPTILGQIHPALQNLSGIPLVIFLLVALLTSLFLVGYVFQGTRVWLQLGTAVRRINALKRKDKKVDPEDVGRVLRKAPFKHLWDEYNDTLHLVRKAGNGAMALSEVRATVPAEVYFTRDVLVDSRLFDDFTRHLPGVLTGLGIIGTFAGLLDGLSRFDATSTTTAVAGLKPLLDGVAHAFTASAIAIGCAMGVTFISKFCLAIFYGQVEKLNHAVDALYSTGAGEEYLSRLVLASEKSEAHAAQLKQALVEDMTKLMTNLVERQIAAQNKSHQELGQHIGASFAGSLAEPLKKITEVMENTSKGNGEAVNGMLESMLTGFMAKLEDTFGGQMRGITEQMNHSMGAMTTVQTALQNLVEKINQSNQDVTDRMSGTIEEAMKRAADNQTLLTEQMREFVQDFRRLVAEEQEKSNRAMDQTMAKLLEQLSLSVQHLEQVRKNAAGSEEQRNKDLANRTEELVGGLSGGVESLIAAVNEQILKTQQNIDAIGAVSTRAIDGMNDGALNMENAAKRFAGAGDSVNGVFEKASAISTQLGTTATTLQSAATAIRDGFEKYDSTRKTVDEHVAVLKDLIKNSREEAGLSQQMLKDLERIIIQLKAAETQSVQYLEGVNKTLVEAFESFGNHLNGQIKKSISETDRHLSSGVQQLVGVVQELAAALARLKKL